MLQNMTFLCEKILLSACVDARRVMTKFVSVTQFSLTAENLPKQHRFRMFLSE